MNSSTFLRAFALFPLCAALGGVSFAAPAATPHTLTSWGTDDGLAGNQVRSIVQDRRGYLWLGTNAGVQRFDGVRFVRWEETGRPTLPQPNVRALCLGTDGSMWIGFDGVGGVAHFVEGALRFYSAADGLRHGAVTDLLQSRDGSMWAAGPDGLSQFRDGIWHEVQLAPDMAITPIYGLFEDPSGALWAGGTDEVFRRAQGETAFVAVSRNARVRSFFSDKHGVMWVTHLTRAIARLKAGAPEALPSFASAGSELLYDQQHNLWAGTYGGGLLRIVDGELVERFTTREGLSHDVVHAIFEDREGSIWVGTNGGLTRLSRSVVRNIAGSSDTIIQRVRTVATDGNDGIWIGTMEGLHHYSGGNWLHYREVDGLPAPSVSLVYKDTLNTAWIVTEGGLARFDGRRLVPIPLPSQVQTNRINGMAVDPDGGMWLLDNDRHLFRWHRGTLTPQAETRAVRSLFVHKDGSVWIGSVEGDVTVWRGGLTRVYTKADGLSGDSIGSIYQDRRGTVWVGATGLSRFENGRFFTLGPANGFPDDQITAMVEADDYLWLRSGKGITRLAISEVARAVADPAYQVRYTILDRSHGIPGDQPTGQPSVAIDGQGMLWFGTTRGLATVDTHDIPTISVAPLVTIESGFIDGKRVEPIANFKVPASIATLQIDYTGLYFLAPTKVRFKYMLDGFDTNWIDAGSRRQAFYTNLPPRQYRFRVIAESDGLGHSSSTSWDFTVAPRFYQTTWFLLATAIGLAGCASTAWRYRVRQVGRQFALIHTERTRMAREIHDTLLQSLVGVALDLEDLGTRVVETPSEASEELRALRKRVEMYVRETRQSIWDLRSPILEGRTLAAALRDTCESITATQSARVNVSISGAPLPSPPRVDEQLLRIAQEAVVNAIRHAAAQTIAVTLRYTPDAIALLVEDDGRGFDVTDTRMFEHHWGVVSMQERAQQIGAVLHLTSAQGLGTRIEAVWRPSATMEMEHGHETAYSHPLH